MTDKRPVKIVKRDSVPAPSQSQQAQERVPTPVWDKGLPMSNFVKTKQDALALLGGTK